MANICSSCGGDNPEGMRFCGHCGAPLATATPGPSQQVTEDRTQQVTEALKSFVSGQVAERLLESGGRITEERRLVTCLFADLSGFTPLADRLDPERLLEVIDPVINRLTNVVGRYGGYVDKFAGDALLAFFGAPVAHEDDSARALHVALEMHRELKRMLPELPPDTRELTLHCGVNSGHVIARVLGTEVRMDYSVLGDAVILAQRLESAAPAGETYVGETTYRLVRGRFELEPVGEITLKGKAKPVPAWRLVHERPFSGRPIERFRFVGREKELQAVTAVVESLVTRKQGGVVAVSGEAGVGKSRLVQEMRAHAQTAGATWLRAQCLSYGSNIPLWPYADLLRRMADIGPDTHDQAAHLLHSAVEQMGIQKYKPHFARLLGLPAPEIDELEPEAFRRQLIEAFQAAAWRLAGRGPVIVAVEDVHWADSSSINLTTELAKLTRSIPIAIVMTGRPDSTAVMGSIAAAADPDRGVGIHLEPFDESTVDVLVESILEGPAPVELTTAVRARTLGNPFFIQEMVRTLQDAGHLTKERGAWVLGPHVDLEAVPPTLEGILGERIDALPRRAATVLQTAAVIGRRVSIPLLEAVDDEPRGLTGELELLVDGGFLDREEGDRLTFHHALLQDVAYSRLLRKYRTKIHRKVADEAERLFGAGEDVIDLVARHLYLGDAGLKAVDYLMRAADRAERLYANEEAVLHLRRALEVCLNESDAAERVADIHLRLADLLRLTGSYDEAIELYEEVRKADGRVGAWKGLAFVNRNLGRFDETLALIDDAFSGDGFTDRELAELWLERVWTLARAGQFQEAVDASEQGLGLIGADASRLEADLLVQRARAEVILRRLDDALAHAERAVAILEERKELSNLATALRVLGDAYIVLERLQDAESALRRGLEIAHRTGAAEEIGGCLINLEATLMEQGRYEEAIRTGREAISQFEAIGHVPGVAMGHVNLAKVLLESDRLDDAMFHSERALEVASGIGHTMTIADALWDMAVVHLKRGRYQEAIAKAEEAAQIYLEMEAEADAAEAFDVMADALEKSGDAQRAREVRSRARALES